LFRENKIVPGTSEVPGTCLRDDGSFIDNTDSGAMAIILKSTDAQQNFGAMLENIALEEDIVVEHLGSPYVAIVNYRRYQALIAAETELVRLRLQQASAAASERAADLSGTNLDNLIKEARSEDNNGAKR
jgi:hypothetical protein